MDEIIYHYDKEKRPPGAVLEGVPLQDLTAADIETMPGWLRQSVADCAFYVAVKRPKVPIKKEGE